MEPMENRDLKESRVSKAILDLRVSRAFKGFRGFRVTPVLRESRVMPVPKEFKESKESKESKVLRASMVPTETTVLKEYRESKENPPPSMIVIRRWDRCVSPMGPPLRMSFLP
jgi:hypothetical protein